MSRAGCLVLMVTVIAGVGIALMIMTTRTTSASDGTMAAQEPSPPPWFGGRVEMPEHGFAVTFPEDWVAYDPGADVDGQVEVTHARFTGLPTVDSTNLRWAIPYAQTQGAQLLAIEFSEHVIEHLVQPQFCSFGVAPDGAIRLDEASMDRMLLAYASEESVADVEPPKLVELPVGSGWALAMTTQPDDLDDWRPVVSYFVKAGDDALLVTCTGPERPDDDWLSIAETFEFLPAEE